MIKIKFDWRKEDLKYIEKMPGKFKTGLIKGMRMAMFFAEGESKKGFLSGKGPPHPTILTARTGHLRRSIKSGVDGTKGFLKTDVGYGYKHEVDPGRRPFLMPALENNIDKIGDIIMDNITRSFK